MDTKRQDPKNLYHLIVLKSVVATVAAELLVQNENLKDSTQDPGTWQEKMHLAIELCSTDRIVRVWPQFVEWAFNERLFENDKSPKAIAARGELVHLYI